MRSGAPRAVAAAVAATLALLLHPGAAATEPPPATARGGEPITLDFQDIETRAALQLLADIAERNLVASDAVSGSLTLRLTQVPWDRALDLILRTQGLDKREIGNVLLVAPAAEIAERERLELERRRQFSELAPLDTEFIQIRYASAAELFALLGGAEHPAALSDRGSVLVDDRTNAVILTDTADRIAQIRDVIARLDVPVRQVVIESRIVNANANFSTQLGIRWGGAALRTRGGTTVKLGGGLGALEALQRSATEGTEIPSSPDRPVTDLGVSGSGTTRLGIGVTDTADYLLDVEISALASEGHAEVIARPTLITTDKQPATIQSGVEIPYQEASSSGATSTSFKEAVLSLAVTPRITPDERIIMDLAVHQDSVGQLYNGVPSIDTTSVTTRVLVQNGETIVLGGMFRTNRNLEIAKTPLLGDLPVLGRLFRRTLKRDDKQELLIFITPRIVGSGPSQAVAAAVAGPAPACPASDPRCPPPAPPALKSAGGDGSVPAPHASPVPPLPPPRLP